MDAVLWARWLADTMAEATSELALGRPPEHLIARRIGDWFCADLVCYGRLDRQTGAISLQVWPEANVPPVALAAATIPDPLAVLHHWPPGHDEFAMVSTVLADRRWRASAACALLRGAFDVRAIGCARLTDGATTAHMIGLARDRELTRNETGQLGLLRRPVVALSRHAAWLAAREQLDGTPYDTPLSAGEIGITHREQQVLELLADGLLAVSIGRRLALSPRTVHHHLGHIYAKLGTHDRLSAVVRAQEAGLLGPPRS